MVTTTVHLWNLRVYFCRNFQHENLVKLYGVCTAQGPVFIIQELMSQGTYMYVCVCVCVCVCVSCMCVCVCMCEMYMYMYMYIMSSINVYT